jgi:hypothetical protein
VAEEQFLEESEARDAVERLAGLVPGVVERRVGKDGIVRHAIPAKARRDGTARKVPGALIEHRVGHLDRETVIAARVWRLLNERGPLSVTELEVLIAETGT